MTLVPNEAEQALNRQYDIYAAAREEYRKKITEQAEEIDRLRAALKDARVSVEGWADYASDYIKEKWDLKGDLARIDAALEGKDD